MNRLTTLFSTALAIVAFQNCAPAKEFAQEPDKGASGFNELVKGLALDSRALDDLRAQSIDSRFVCHAPNGVSCPTFAPTSVPLQTDVRLQLLEDNRVRLITNSCGVPSYEGHIEIRGFEKNFIRVRVDLKQRIPVAPGESSRCWEEFSSVASVLNEADRLVAQSSGDAVLVSIGTENRDVKFANRPSVLGAYNGTYSTVIVGAASWGQAALVARLVLTDETFSLDTGGCLGSVPGEIKATRTADATVFKVQLSIPFPPTAVNCSTLSLENSLRDRVVKSTSLKINADRSLTLSSSDGSVTFRRDPVWGND